MFLRYRSGAREAPAEHVHVHVGIARYLEWAQDAIVAALALILLVVMVQALLTLGRVALFEGLGSRVVLPQILLLLILVELFRTLLFYLREHRVSVGLMIEVAIVSVLRELLINPPGTELFNAMGMAVLLLSLCALMIADRLTDVRNRRQEAVPDPDPKP